MPSDDSVASLSTTVTLDDFNNLNSQVQSISSVLAANQSQNNEILQLLRLNTKPPSTERAGLPPSADSDAGDTFCDAGDGFE